MRLPLRIRALFARWAGLGSPDATAFMAELTGPRTWTRLDRYHDFRAVFQGTSTPEQGRRVLAEILKKGGMFAPAYVAGDRDATLVRAGARDLCQWMVAVMNAEPTASNGDEHGGS